MKRPAPISYSLLISVGMLYVLLLASTVFFSEQVIKTLGADTEVGPFFSYFLGGLLPLGLVVALVLQVGRLVFQIRQNKPGTPFKIRVVLFFSSLVLMATLPQAMMFARFINGVMGTALVTDAQEGLQDGVTLALEAYRETTRALDATVQPGLRALWTQGTTDPDLWWQRLQTLPRPPGAMEVRGPKGYRAYGDELLWLGEGASGDLGEDYVDRRAILAGTVLRRAFQTPQGYQVVLAALVSPELENTATRLSRIRDRFLTFIDARTSISPALSVLFLSFMLPLVLLALIAGFYLADEIIKPLVNLEATMALIARGDLSLRLTARRGDEMGFLVNTFNRMMYELGRSRDHIKQSERLQTWQDIAQRMAHEIKNPLTPIKLSAQRMLHRYHGDDAEYRRILEDSTHTIVREVDHLASMLSEFRNFARLPLPTKILLDIRDVVQETWQPYLNVPGMSLGYQEAVPVRAIPADRNQMRQVFHNLFQNSIDAMGGTGTIEVRVHQLTKTSGEFLRIMVLDTGPGIPADQVAQVFTPYWTSKKHGNGLGLSMVEKIMIDHGGKVWCDPGQGSGACFVLELPYE